MTANRVTSIVAMCIAAFVALAVPISQLRIACTVVTCCCPDPSNCHCPHETSHDGTTPTMRPCHRVGHDLVMADAPACAVAQLPVVSPGTRIAVLAALTPHSPHASPDPIRPSAPS